MQKVRTCLSDGCLLHFVIQPLSKTSIYSLHKFIKIDQIIPLYFNQFHYSVILKFENFKSISGNVVPFMEIVLTSRQMKNRDIRLDTQIGKFPNGQLMICQVLIQIGIQFYLSSRVELVDYLNGELSHDNHI